MRLKRKAPKNNWKSSLYTENPIQKEMNLEKI
jgi:hypothetical protein